MSVKLTLYNDIETELKTLDFIKNVLHYNGQELNNFEEEQALSFPQAWIQLTGVDWQYNQQTPSNSNITQEQKTDNVIINIYYAYFSLEDDNISFKKVLTDVDLIYRSLTNLKGDYYTDLMRAGEQDLPTNNNVKIWQQQYTTMMTECGVSKNFENVAPLNLEITPIIV